VPEKTLAALKERDEKRACKERHEPKTNTVAPKLSVMQEVT